MSIHADYAGNNTDNHFPGPFSNPSPSPAVARVKFAQGWDGGDVTLGGTTSDGKPASEVFAHQPGNTVTGKVQFKTVTSATKGAVGASSAAARID